MKKIIVFLLAVIFVLSMTLTAYAEPIESTESLFYFYDAEWDLPLYDVYLTNVELSFEAVGDIEAMKATVLEENDPHFRMNGSEIFTSLNYEHEPYVHVAIFYYYQAELAEEEARQAQFVMNISGGTKDWICLDFDLKCNEWTLQTFDLSLADEEITQASVHQIGINLKGSINEGKGYPNEAMFVKYMAFFQTAEAAQASTVESMKAMYDYEYGIGLPTNPPVNDDPTATPEAEATQTTEIEKTLSPTHQPTKQPTLQPTDASNYAEEENAPAWIIWIIIAAVAAVGIIVAALVARKHKRK